MSDTPSTVTDPFSTQYLRHGVRRLDEHAQPLPFLLDGPDAPDCVDVALDVVPAELLAGSDRRLDVDAYPPARGFRASCADRLGNGVERNGSVGDRRRGQAAAVDRDRVADTGAGRRLRRAHDEGLPAGGVLRADDDTDLAHDPREHAREGN